MPGNLLILGASARAAAFSALRAGFLPWCLDLYADEDLRKRCPAMALRGPYPNAFLTEVSAAPQCPWLYTGALENHAFLISQLADLRSLWGNGPTELAVARDPQTVSYYARAAGLSVPRLGTWPPGPGLWLVKPLRGGGGTGVRFWNDDLPPLDRDQFYLQEYIDGPALSAVFCAANDGTVLLGASQQLIGTPWLNAGGFRYAGNVGPYRLSDTVRPGLLEFGRQLGRAGLRGLFGVDCILADGSFWPVEINPRYTAGVEVLELATGLQSLAHHARAFGAWKGPTSVVPAEADTVVGKAILYAPEDLTFPSSGPWLDVVNSSWSVDDVPPFADVPTAGTEVGAGGPVLTLLARGRDDEDCLRTLRERAEEVERLLWPHLSTGGQRVRRAEEDRGHFTGRSER